MTHPTPHSPRSTPIGCYTNGMIATFAVLALFWLCVIACLVALAIVAFSGALHLTAYLPPTNILALTANITTPDLQLGGRLSLTDCGPLVGYGFNMTPAALGPVGDGLLIDFCARAIVRESDSFVFFYW